MKINFLFATLVFVMVILLIGVVEILGISFSFFEDGSFRLTGCIPWHICS